eukprot:m.181415 g.181415  ORF g.181415 m.181415 type:complete len:478 (-) comp32063_c0_seq1:165-1598(-)
MWVTLLITIGVLVVLNKIKELLFAPKNLPPVYSEFPYVPWLGSIVQYAIEPREFLQRAHEKCGDIFTVNLLGSSMTYLMSSEGHAQFFGGKEDVYDIREAYKCTVVTFGPDVCYDCPVPKMGEQLGFFKTGLTADKFPGYVETIQDEVEKYFTETWGDSGEACIMEALSQVFTLTSARCLLGPEIREQWTGEMAALYLDLDHSFIPITFFFPNLPNPMRSKCVKARTIFQKMFKEVAKERRANPNVAYDDFLQVLMDAKYKNGQPLTEAEITGIMIGTLLGGQHTSNVTGSWLLAHLFLNPEWRKKIMDEQSEILDGNLLEDLVYEDVTRMVEFDKVLNETLRLHPPFFMLARVCMQDTEYQGQIIPKGNFVAVSPGAAQRLEQFWGTDADSFDPNRWTAEAKKEHKQHSWIPFGGGKHQCSGRKFAQVSLKTALAWLLRNYELDFQATELPKEDYTTMVVAPKAPVTVKYKRKTPV